MKYKYSRFNVFSPEFNGKVIVYNSFKERMILIDNQKVFEKYIENEVIPLEENIFKIFKESDIIVEKSKNEVEDVIIENQQAIKYRKTLSFTIFPSSNCQLGCVYCGQVHSKMKMGSNLHNKIIEKIQRLIPGKLHLNIGWFGAEPLLEINTIEKLTPKLRDIAFQNGCTYGASITTNGLLLNEKNIPILLENGVDDITLD